LIGDTYQRHIDASLHIQCEILRGLSSEKGNTVVELSYDQISPDLAPIIDG
jgi:hypothetical protein